MQQTPNPEAQLPSAIPPDSPHSSALRQIPFMEDVDVDEATTHSSLGNYRRWNHGHSKFFDNKGLKGLVFEVYPELELYVFTEL